MKETDILVIGAGVSGLSFSAQCNSDYYIVEKDNKAGGLCRTFHSKGFVWDYAGHFFHFANPNIKAEFENEIQKNDLVKCKKNTNINYNGISIDYPFQMNIHELPKDEFIDCLYDLFHRPEKKEYRNFEEMLYGKFGKSITDKFLRPYNEKLYACDLNELDVDAMGRFFPFADPIQIIDNMKGNGVKTYNSTFDYPKEGAEFFVNILLKKIDSNRLKLGSTVEKIFPEMKLAVVDGEVIHYKALVNTSPLNKFLNLLPQEEEYDIKPYLSSNKVLVFNLGFDKEAINKKIHWTYFPMKEINFYRCGYYNNILNTNRLSMYIEIGFKEDEFIDVDKQLEMTLINLKKLGLISDHKLIAYNSVLIDPGYVHVTQISNENVKILKDKLKKHNIFTIGRYGGWKYCSIEDCMIEAQALANQINMEF